MKPRKSSISCPNLDNSKFMCNSNISSIFTENVRRGQCNSGSCSKERKHYYDAEKGLGKLPLPVDVIAEFMAKISMVKSRNSPIMKQASCAHVGGYRSAIVDLYKSNNLKFEDEAVIGMSDFSSGYKRLVADKKLNGEMEVQE